MPATLVTVLFLAIAWIEGVPLYRQGHKREATIFTIVWILTLAYTFPVTIGFPVPNPVEWLENIFSPLLPLSFLGE